MEKECKAIEERFFKHISKDEQHLDEIRARGEQAMRRVDESPSKPSEVLSKTVVPNLAVGNYHLSLPGAKVAISIE